MQTPEEIVDPQYLNALVMRNAAILDALVMTVGMQVPDVVPLLLQLLEAQQRSRSGLLQSARAKEFFEIDMNNTRQFLEQLQGPEKA